MDLSEVVDRWLGCAERGAWDEWASFFSPEALVYQNFLPGEASSAADSAAGFQAMAVSTRFENIRRIVREGIVVEFHDERLAMGGKEAVFEVAMVVQFDAEGRIIRVDEYADSAQLAPLMS